MKKRTLWASVIFSSALVVLGGLFFAHVFFFQRHFVEQAMLSGQQIEIALFDPAALAPSAAGSGNISSLPSKPLQKPTSIVKKANAHIVLIIGDMGINQTITEQAIQLPKTVTLGFSPYAPQLDQWVERAYEAGHDVLLHAPMESAIKTEAGPYLLSTSHSPEHNQRQLAKLLRTNFIHGIYSAPNAIFSHSVSHAVPILETLQKQQLAYIASPKTVAYLSKAISNMQHVSHAYDVVIDEGQHYLAIERQLARAESLAKQQGLAIILAAPYPNILRHISQWHSTLPQRSINLTALSQLPLSSPDYASITEGSL